MTNFLDLHTPISMASGTDKGARARTRFTFIDQHTKDSTEEQLVNKCGSCDSTVLQSDRGIVCNLCNFWFHSKCQGVSKTKYEWLSKGDPDVSWHFRTCLPTACTFNEFFKKMNMNHEQLKTDIEQIKSDVKSNREEIEKLSVAGLENVKADIRANKVRLDILSGIDNIGGAEIDSADAGVSVDANRAFPIDIIIEKVVERRLDDWAERERIKCNVMFLDWLSQTLNMLM